MAQYKPMGAVAMTEYRTEYKTGVETTRKIYICPWDQDKVEAVSTRDTGIGGKDHTIINIQFSSCGACIRRLGLLHESLDRVRARELPKIHDFRAANPTYKALQDACDDSKDKSLVCYHQIVSLNTPDGSTQLLH